MAQGVEVARGKRVRAPGGGCHRAWWLLLAALMAPGVHGGACAPPLTGAQLRAVPVSSVYDLRAGIGTAHGSVVGARAAEATQLRLAQVSGREMVLLGQALEQHRMQSLCEVLLQRGASRVSYVKGGAAGWVLARRAYNDFQGSSRELYTVSDRLLQDEIGDASLQLVALTPEDAALLKSLIAAERVHLLPNTELATLARWRRQHPSHRWLLMVPAAQRDRVWADFLAAPQPDVFIAESSPSEFDHFLRQQQRLSRAYATPSEASLCKGM